MLRIATFNVNGIRAAQRRGFETWLEQRRPDVVALQEVRAQDKDVPAGVFGDRFFTYHSGELPGRNGVAFVTTTEPSAVRRGFGHHTDHEGRYIEIDLDLPDAPPLTLGSLYLPKGASPHDKEPNVPKYEHKMEFMASFKAYLDQTRQAAQQAGREFLVMGDFNIAHAEVDLKNWRANRRNEGFLPEEREWFGSLLESSDLHDVVRRRHPDQSGPYSWWSWRGRAFDNDAGWRIDYHLATPGLSKAAVVAGTDKDASADARISDHAPVVVDYEF